jgi:hypothetical protein
LRARARRVKDRVGLALAESGPGRRPSEGSHQPLAMFWPDPKAPRR